MSRTSRDGEDGDVSDESLSVEDNDLSEFVNTNLRRSPSLSSAALGFSSSPPSTLPPLLSRVAVTARRRPGKLYEDDMNEDGFGDEDALSLGVGGVGGVETTGGGVVTGGVPDIPSPPLLSLGGGGGGVGGGGGFLSFMSPDVDGGAESFGLRRSSRVAVTARPGKYYEDDMDEDDLEDEVEDALSLGRSLGSGVGEDVVGVVPPFISPPLGNVDRGGVASSSGLRTSSCVAVTVTARPGKRGKRYEDDSDEDYEEEEVWDDVQYEEEGVGEEDVPGKRGKRYEDDSDEDDEEEVWDNVEYEEEGEGEVCQEEEEEGVGEEDVDEDEFSEEENDRRIEDNKTEYARFSAIGDIIRWRTNSLLGVALEAERVKRLVLEKLDDDAAERLAAAVALAEAEHAAEEEREDNERGHDAAFERGEMFRAELIALESESSLTDPHDVGTLPSGAIVAAAASASSTAPGGIDSVLRGRLHKALRIAREFESLFTTSRTEIEKLQGQMSTLQMQAAATSRWRVPGGSLSVDRAQANATGGTEDPWLSAASPMSRSSRVKLAQQFLQSVSPLAVDNPAGLEQIRRAASYAFRSNAQVSTRAGQEIGEVALEQWFDDDGKLNTSSLSGFTLSPRSRFRLLRIRAFLCSHFDTSDIKTIEFKFIMFLLLQLRCLNANASNVYFGSVLDQVKMVLKIERHQGYNSNWLKRSQFNTILKSVFPQFAAVARPCLTLGRSDIEYYLCSNPYGHRLGLRISSIFLLARAFGSRPIEVFEMLFDHVEVYAKKSLITSIFDLSNSKVWYKHRDKVFIARPSRLHRNVIDPFAFKR